MNVSTEFETASSEQVMIRKEETLPSPVQAWPEVAVR
jgi:hypothetical protein